MKFIKRVWPTFEDPDNSVDLFDANRANQFGGQHCVAPAILESQVEGEWIAYQIATLEKHIERKVRALNCSDEKFHAEIIQEKERLERQLADVTGEL